jgi:hypothetical protein
MLAPVRRTTRRRWTLARLALIALVASVSLGGCRACAGPVNASPGLRWWLFANFGASKICPEMIKRGVGLKLQSRGNSIGRFFPTGCTIDVNGEAQTVTVNFSGHGYGYMPVTRRFGFTASASVEYRPDFYFGEEAVYVWGVVNRIPNGPNFQVGYIENGAVDLATAFTPLGGLANMFGNQIVAGEVTKGFTVLENWETDSKTFTLGIIKPPQKPHTPYDVSQDDVYTFANEAIDVNYNQRDFLGPFEVVDNRQILMMKMFLQGPAVDVMVVDKQVGDQWRDAYIQGRPLGPPPGPVRAGGPLQPGREVRTAYSLPPGQYYVVVDHTQYAGTVNPPPAGLLSPITGGGPIAKITYVAQLGER